MPAPDNQTCKLCKLWEPVEGQTYGVCHRWPQLRSLTAGKLDHDTDADRYVKQDDWCGEWMKK